jgi:hypothetical protein
MSGEAATAFDARVMKVSPYAGKPAEASILVNAPGLVTAYCTEEPDPSVPEQRVAFGTFRTSWFPIRKVFQ